MSLAQALQQSGAIDSMARELGVDSHTAQSAAGALLPAIVAGLGRNHMGAGETGGSGGGLANILGGLAGGGGAGGLAGIGGALLNQVLHSDPTPTQPGNDILGQIFGSKDVSRGVADEVAGSTGLSADLLKKDVADARDGGGRLHDEAAQRLRGHHAGRRGRSFGRRAGRNPEPGGGRNAPPLRRSTCS